ncbi:cytochrome P450 [Sporodiniella umbellata]|nr:cytochrome P450 [Sporodiniella umbellata]
MGVCGVTGYYVFRNLIYRLYLDPLNKIPGPRVSWIPFMGNFFELIRAEIDASPLVKWTEEYGGIFTYHFYWNEPRLVVTDEKLLKQMLTTQVYDFRKPDVTYESLKRVLGHGLVLAEGETHRQQRKMLNPAFSVSAIREMVPMMLGPAKMLCDQWKEKLRANPGGYTELDVSEGLSLVTLDIIGITGFGQDLKSLTTYGTEQFHRFSRAYLQLFSVPSSLFQLLQIALPVLGYLPTRANRKYALSLRWLREESQALIEAGAKRHEQERHLPEHQRHKDLLARMFHLIDKDDGKRFSQEELRDQCLTFLAAGHETTSNTLCWCLWLLAQHQEIQDSVRSESQVLFEEGKLCDYDAIQALPYLNSVFRETLRMIPAVPRTLRMTCAPVALGTWVIPQGTVIEVSPLVTHRSKAIWGKDAHTFRPTRWIDGQHTLGNTYQFLPFLAGGRQCIGYRFATVEFKLVLVVLLKEIRFFLKPDFKVEKKQGLTTRAVPNMLLWAKPVL